MALETLAYNDVLNNDIAHFFKSGAIKRSKENSKLDKIHHLLPEKGNYGTNLEYDIWYEFIGDRRIRGYLYTDVMTKFVYLKPASSKYCREILNASLQEKISEEGELIFQDIKICNTDKYKLKETDEEYPYVIFLPGTNILGEILDEVKTEQAIKRKQAKLKPHPLTSPFCMSYLKCRFGKENILERKFSGHDLLNRCRTVGFCSNSEMGIIGLAQGKRIERLDNKKVTPKTYTALYNALYKDGYPVIDDLKRILSSEYSGLVSHLSKNPQEKINNFFDYFKDIEHVKPKKPKTLNTRRK